MKDYEILKSEIKKAGRTHKWLALKLDIPYDTFSAYMVGRRKLTKEVEQRIKKLL